MARWRSAMSTAYAPYIVIRRGSRRKLVCPLSNARRATRNSVDGWNWRVLPSVAAATCADTWMSPGRQSMEDKVGT